MALTGQLGATGSRLGLFQLGAAGAAAGTPQDIAGLSAGTSTTIGHLRMAWALSGTSTGTSTTTGTLVTAAVGWLESSGGIVAFVE